MNQSEKEQTFVTAFMIRFLSNNIKFTMSSSLKDFVLKFMSSRMLFRSNITIRFINDVFCEVLSNAAKSKQDKEKNIRERSDDIVFMIAMTNHRMHIYDETEEIITRANIVWRKDFQISTKRKIIVKQLHNQHFKNKIIIIAENKSLIKQWILQRRIWEFILTINLFIAQNLIIVWSSNMNEETLINYHITIQENIIDEDLVIAVINDFINTNQQFSSNSEIKSFSKRRKFVTKTKHSDHFEESLHSDLQICIISNFRTINIKQNLV